MSRPPNILFIMADQMAAPALPFHGHPVVKTPNLSRLAAEGVVFDNAYCNYPLCAPSRFALLSGRLPSAIGAFDNAAEFASSVPTFVHYARAAGYRTCLSGKMHFVGADQLHGFEERLTTDVYPADFGWTPDWGNGALAYDWSHHMASVIEAGPCHRSLQIDFDEETAHQAVQKIYDYGRTADEAPSSWRCPSRTRTTPSIACRSTGTSTTTRRSTCLRCRPSRRSGSIRTAGGSITWTGCTATT